MRWFIISLWLLGGFCGVSQNLSYIRYTVKDGLPGSMVYQALQDKNGFIWFATNQGVSRFDGKTFKNFTKEDGLPDNDIIKLYMDRHNILWFISYMGIPSYFCNGAIHRLDSCQGVSAITEDFKTDSIFFVTGRFKDIPQYFGYLAAVNTPGRWHFTQHAYMDNPGFYNLSILTASSKKKTNFYYSLVERKTCRLTMKDAKSSVSYTFSCDTTMGYFPFKNKPLVELTGGKDSILFYANQSIFLASRAGITSILSSREMELKYRDLNAIFYENDSTLWLCMRDKGLVRVRNYLRRDKSFQSFFREAFCTGILKDREGGYWLTTNNDGVYYLPNLDAYYVSDQPSQLTKDVKCIRVLDAHNLLAGFGDGNILSMDYERLKAVLLPRWPGANRNNRVLDIQVYKPGKTLVVSDYGIDLLYNDNKADNKIAIYGGKCAYVISDSSMLFGCSYGLFWFNPWIRKPKSDTVVFLQRATCINGKGLNYYWGTFKGLYHSSGNVVTCMGQTYPELNVLVNHIDIAPDSTLWISTQQGVVVLKNGHATAIREKQGLLNNMCKHVLINGNTAWVSTSKGISRIVYHWENNTPVYSISNITENDGLISSDINQTAAAGNYIWAATAGGLCFFSKDYAPHSMQPPLININTIVNGNNEMITGDTVAIDYKKNKLLIGLSGISFRSGKQIRYQYRLKDLDSNWTNTTTNLLEFSTLPFGNHIFEVRAIDRWGVKSCQVKKVVILVQPPFWKTSWFTFLTYLFTAVIIGLGAYFYSRRQQWDKDKRYQLNKRMAELEMMALRAQMNPHFVFNCLSSIQYYILRADIINANLYLHKFSSLIRKILQFSTTTDITLEEELKILELYLELEKLRLGDRMEYRITVADYLRITELIIPSMIIQPYVENAVKHGISPLQDKQGIVRIDFRQEGNSLVCTIDDNGIGINESIQAQKTNASGHRSMGIGITESRINIINAIQKDKMVLEITDKTENGLHEQGTVVRLHFPI